MDTAELLLHPVRVRIVHAMSGRTMTTAQLCERLPDVSKATMYRQVGLLAEAGILEIDSEQRVRGAVERSYRLNQHRAVIDTETAGAMSLEQHKQGFGAAMAGLIAEFDAYLGRPNSDLVHDFVSYRQGTLWLTEAERAEMVAEIRQAVVSRFAHEATPERTRHLMSLILFPAEEPAAPTPTKR